MMKAIIFDFFGVFYLDLYWVWLGKKIPNLEKRRSFFQDLSDKLDKNELTEEKFLQTLSEESGTPRDSVIDEMFGEVSIDQELISLLSRFKNKYKIGLLSNARGEWLREILEKEDIAKYFDELVISSEVGTIKPQPEIFEEMLKCLEVGKNEALFIDDRAKNVTAAKKFGIKSLLYESNEKLIGDLKKLGLLDPKSS
ncbi:MAG: HAD family phosphatase [Candidatus Woykebacteria bacterium]